MHPEGLDLLDQKGNERGFVDPKYVDGRSVLEDLWVMQGSVCDLRCKHCYTASSPSNNRLQQITSAELVPHLEAATDFGRRATDIRHVDAEQLGRVGADHEMALA